MGRVAIENGRAAFAFECVQNHVQEQKDEKKRKEYRAYVKKLPTMIQVNGLGQTLAFCYSKKDEYQVIYDQLEAWAGQQQAEIIDKYKREGRKEFVEIVASMDSSDYRLISNEVLALLNWMRRFAEGMIRER